jgi:hypothetical protein
MRNLSLMFAILSFTVLVFGIITFFVSKDKQVLQIAGIGTVLFILGSSFVNALSIPSDVEKARAEQTQDSQFDALWHRMDAVETNNFNDLDRLSRDFDSRVSSIWRDLDAVTEKCENTKNRK